MEIRHSGYEAWAARWRVPLGFALSLAYLVLARPTPRLLAVGSGVALVGLLLRAWAAGYLEKGSSLATSGPYAFTRNPLYLGSALIGAGFAVAGRSALMAAAFIVLLVIVYRPVIRREERFLSQKFGSAYRDYAACVPLFLPRLRPSTASKEHFRWRRYRKNREYEAAMGWAAGVALLALKMAFRGAWTGFL
jgi:protein-S-isoprenylcysteine O-methyltransferase Ste14